jgi:hypothetical protein
LRAHVIESGGWNNIDSSDEAVERAIKAIQDVILELIIVDRLPGSSKFRSISFHLGYVLLGGHVQLLRVGEGATKGGDPRLGLRGIQRMKRAPNFSGMNKAIYGGENVLGKGIHEVADHLLVPSDPSVVGRIRNRDLLLVCILRI